MAVRATLWADVICPFCYLAAAPFGRLRAEGAIDLVVRPFEIHPETPREGVPLERFGKAKLDDVFRSVQWMAGEAGLDVRRPEKLPNSRRALEGMEMARAAKGEAAAVEFAGRVMGAYFKDGADVGDEATLRAIADAMKIDRGAQDRCFLNRGFAGALAEARRGAEDALVTAVPAASVGGFPVVGYQPYAQLKKLVERAARRA
ncbi:MAG TPA: DsbA family protein [Planctomycetota bacterium]|nr:DsbA family protein [Planctomycetota bacterium]